MVDVARENVVCLEDVARKFDVSLQTVRNWANRSGHRLETIRVGRLVRTSWEAVQRFAVDNAQESLAVQVTRMEHSEHDDAVRRLRARGLQF
jgi:hypothetical protein